MAGVSERPVRILGLKVVERAQDGNSEHGLVAVFSVRVPPFVLHGAKLYRRRNGSPIAAMPQTVRSEIVSSAILIEEDDLREQIARAACDVARVLGASVDPREPVDA